MKTFELLDRLEILFPDNTFFADLRKTILSDDQFALFRLLQQQSNSQLIEGMRKYKSSENFNTDCFSRGQLESKLWLIKELTKCNIPLGTVFICAGWYATIAVMLFESDIDVDKIRSFDIDSTCVDIAKVFNKPWVMDDWKFQASTKDIMDIYYDYDSYEVSRADGTTCILSDYPDTIINTSCEHIENFKRWYARIPDGKLVILQSNNFYEIDDHVNCVADIDEFIDTAPMSTVLYSGELELSKYTRFMVIGIK
tara:strand:+ start:1469 stop:2230 length:762 start_codon:yes stop_codon:yes gene_type:complete